MNKRDIQRFWFKVDIQDGGRCWEWLGHRNRWGYGAFWLNGKHLRAHRFVYELIHGPIPDGLVVMHSCDNPACVRPDHLSLGTHRDNWLDSKKKGRQVQRNLYGEESPKAKLTDEQVATIRDHYAQGQRAQYLADEYGVGVATIYALIRFCSWKQTGGARPEKERKPRYARKYSDELIAAIHERYAVGDIGPRALARLFGLPYGTVSNLLLDKKRGER